MKTEKKTSELPVPIMPLRQDGSLEGVRIAGVRWPSFPAMPFGPNSGPGTTKAGDIMVPFITASVGT